MRSLASRVVPRLAWLYLTFVGKTSKIVWLNDLKRVQCEQEYKNVLYAFWHGRQVLFPYAYRFYPSATLVSKSKDGELIARTLHLFGMPTVRGSSSRGGARALVQLMKVVESGLSIGITPDGPKGPKRTVSSGVLYLAMKSGKPILPITYSAKRKIIFHGWDDFWIPLPFNFILINYGNPVMVSPQDHLEKKAEELSGELNQISDEADGYCSQKEIRLPEEAVFRSSVAELPSPSLLETLLYFIYNAALVLFSPLILAGIFLRYPKTFLQHFYDGLLMRMGVLKAQEGLRFTDKKRPVWVHASSLGECRAAVPLVQTIRKQYPGVPVLFSSTTFQGVSEANLRCLGDEVIYAPLDIPFILKKVFRKYRPRLILLLESELWPNWIRIAKEFNVKVGIVNGRISQKSTNRYLKVKRATRMLTKKIDFVCARDKADAARFESIGVDKEKVRVTGNLKFDFLPWQVNGAPADFGPKNIFFESDMVLTAGSVREGEEAPVLNAFSVLLKKVPDLKLIFAPRHLENLSSVTQMLDSLNLSYFLKSQISEGAKSRERQVLVWDSLGDLWQAYRQSTIVFVGGSLVPKGGQNPIEPAWFSKPVLFGPYMENFIEPARLLVQNKGAIRIEDSVELASQVHGLLSDPEKIKTVGQNAKKTVEQLFGQSTQRTIAIVGAFI